MEHLVQADGTLIGNLFLSSVIILGYKAKTIPRRYLVPACLLLDQTRELASCHHR